VSGGKQVPGSAGLTEVPKPELRKKRNRLWLHHVGGASPVMRIVVQFIVPLILKFLT
jgi:hypothetical protein